MPKRQKNDPEWDAFQDKVVAINDAIAKDRGGLALKSPSGKKLDTGKRPIEEAPLFGGGQTSLFDEGSSE